VLYWQITVNARIKSIGIKLLTSRFFEIFDFSPNFQKSQVPVLPPMGMGATFGTFTQNISLF